MQDNKNFKTFRQINGASGSEKTYDKKGTVLVNGDKTRKVKITGWMSES